MVVGGQTDLPDVDCWILRCWCLQFLRWFAVVVTRRWTQEARKSSAGPATRLSLVTVTLGGLQFLDLLLFLLVWWPKQVASCRLGDWAGGSGQVDIGERQNRVENCWTNGWRWKSWRAWLARPGTRSWWSGRR